MTEIGSFKTYIVSIFNLFIFNFYSYEYLPFGNLNLQGC